MGSAEAGITFALASPTPSVGLNNPAILVGSADGATPVPLAVAFSAVIPGCSTADAVDALSLLPDGGG